MRAVPRRNPASRLVFLIVAPLLTGGLAGCATPPPASDPEAVADFQQTNDPMEPANRLLYKINDGIDTVLLKPAALVYRAVLPDPVRTGVHNVLDNMGGPVRLANDALEGKPKRAGDTSMRFLINTTVGVAGIFDVAKDLGYPNHDADFALTLANWNVSEGPYLYLPVLGPSSPRDAAGFGADIAIDPFTWIGRGTQSFTYEAWSKTAAGALDQRSRLLDTLDQVKKTALDPYATIRSLYRQNRAGKLAALRASTTASEPVSPPAAQHQGPAEPPAPR
jgi:phospholipid-binding lipoprotein MlaA